jgi:alkylhydroperoxidase/carboxymuconolactone decarboxylase family protein YurZ
MAVYAGFPAAMKAMYTIKEVFIEQARKPKRTKNT